MKMVTYFKIDGIEIDNQLREWHLRGRGPRKVTTKHSTPTPHKNPKIALNDFGQFGKKS